MSANVQTSFDFKKTEHYQKKQEPIHDFIFQNHSLQKFQKSSVQKQALHFLLDFPLYVDIKKNSEQPNESLAWNLLPVYWQSFHILKEYYANPLASLACSRTMLLPHQVQAAIRVVHDIRPRVLIADEVGLGKTIETGLIIKELFLKYNYVKVLLVVPSPLLQQWRTEMKTKFNDDYTVLNGAILKKDPQIVARKNRLLVSIDLAKEDRYRKLFLQENFDIVVFDEAHRLRRDAHKVTKAYQFADDISHKCPALLLLSATPFRGKLEEIYYLIHLIDPDIFGSLSLFLQKFDEENAEGLKEKISPVLIRRRKVDVGGFTKRFVRTVRLNLSAEERVFYDETTEYVKREYNRALQSGQRMKSFVMIIFQKLLDSSSHALLQALHRRKNNLENKFKDFLEEEMADVDLLDDLSESEKEFFFSDEENKEDQESIEQIDPQEMKNEIASLERLIALGEEISLDSKLLTLEKNIQFVKKNGHKKILIFTQFKSTLFYISDYLKKKYKVGVFHGSMNENEKEQEIENFFKDLDILVLTEAGGEGRNLQIASALFNYDLPWSPLKIEQRIGRIHRFGQKRDVHIINFATKDTVAERVLNILENKIRIFENALGESDALLGSLEEELKFHKNFGRFLNEKKSEEEWSNEIEKSTQWARENVDRIDDLLSPEFLDFDMQAFSKVNNGNSQREKLAKDLQELFFMYAKEKNIPIVFLDDPKKKKKLKKFQLQWNLHSPANEKQQKTKATFDYQEAQKNESLELLALGHAWIDQMIHDLQKTFDIGTHLKISNSKKTGVYFHLQVTIKMDRHYRRLFAVFVDELDGKKNAQENFLPQKKITKLQQIRCNDFDPALLPYLEAAIAKIYPQIIDELTKIQRRVLQKIDIQKNRLEESHKEFEEAHVEKLELQKGKAKWFGEQKMTSAISRTKNQIRNQEMNHHKKISDLNRMQNIKISLQLNHSVYFLS